MKSMKVKINDKQSICNTEVRWYISSQVIWIGKEKNYYEIEDLINESYGSFKWLWSDDDTLVFNQDDLNFIGAVIKLNEPIVVKRDKFDAHITEEKCGNLEISERKNFNCKLSDFTEYHVEDDILLSYSKEWDVTNSTIEVKITSDFSIIIQNKEMMGIIIYKASTHLLPDGIHQIGINEDTKSDLCLKLANFFELLKKMDDDLSSHDESELKSAFLEIHEQILPFDEPNYIALRDTVWNVVDYL